MEVKITSTFVVNKKLLNDSEVYKMALYSASSDNKLEKWEIDIIDGWISGNSRGIDSGMFWRFLIENGLDGRIEIIRYS